MFWLLPMLACDDPTIAPVFYAEENSIYDRCQEVEQQTRRALEVWAEGKGDQAREQLIEIVEGPFQDIYPTLYQQDPMAVVRLELAYGQTMQRMKSLRSKGRIEQSEQLLLSLAAMIEPHKKAKLEEEQRNQAATKE